MKKFHDESRVHEMQNRVLDPSHVLVDGQPGVHEAAVEGFRGIARRQVAEKIPARINECIHRVRVALAGPSAFGAYRFNEFRNGRERATCRPRGWKSTFSGRSTGRSSSRTGTTPHFRQSIIGDRSPPSIAAAI